MRSFNLGLIASQNSTEINGSLVVNPPSTRYDSLQKTIWTHMSRSLGPFGIVLGSSRGHNTEHYISADTVKGIRKV